MKNLTYQDLNLGRKYTHCRKKIVGNTMNYYFLLKVLVCLPHVVASFLDIMYELHKGLYKTAQTWYWLQ